MNRRSIIASLLAMVLAPLGLRLPKGRSLPGNSPIDAIARVTAIDLSAGSITIDSINRPMPPMPWPVQADDYVFLANKEVGDG